MARAMSGVAAPFGNHVGVDGQGKPPQNPQKKNLRQKIGTHVVQGHGGQGNELQLIAAQSKPSFG